MTVHERVSDKELKTRSYPYPYDSYETELQIDDIGHSDKIICLGCCIKDDEI